MKKIICSFLAFVLILTSTFTAFAADSSHAKCNELARLVNEFRASDTWYWDSNGSKINTTGLSQLQYDTDLEKIAMTRAKEISVNYSHEKARSCKQLAAEGYYCIKTGENIGVSANDPKAVFQAWKEEDADYVGQSHRRAMLDSQFNSIAIGYCEVSGVYFWVMLFSLKTEENMNQQNTAPQTQTAAKKLKIKSVTAGKKQFTVKWTLLEGISYYQVQYSTSSKFTKKTTKTYNTKKRNTTSLKAKDLKSNKKYYIRVRTVKVKANGTKKYSNWCAVKSVKTK